MNRLSASYSIAGLLTLLLVSPAWCQKSGPPAPSRPSSPSGGSVSTTPGQPGNPSQPSGAQMQTPLYVNGRVLVDGQPVPEPVSVGLTCGLNSVQVIRTDVKGYFQFTLGSGPQGNMDMSAADQTPMAGMSGMGSSRGLGGYGASGGLEGCELRINVPGYQPLMNTITEPPDLRSVDVGTLELRRIAGVSGSSISVTSMLVPGAARKEFDKGAADARNNKLPSATQHFEKAVAAYDKYAAAWTNLGQIYSKTHEMEKAQQAFQKAITADPKYIPPYLGLATLFIQTQQYEGAVDMAGKALELDSNLGVASFLEATGNYKLNHMDEAEKSARDAEKEPHQNFPQVHVILTDILLRKQDYSDAAAEMRAYLKEAPAGSFAADMKKNLDQIDKSVASSASESGSSATQPPIAPSIAP